MRQADKLLILSRRAGSMTPAAESRLREAFVGHRVIYFNARRDFEPLITSKAQVVIAGGDGTVEHVVRKLADSQHPLGIIPMGSFNNFAHALGLILLDLLPASEPRHQRGKLIGVLDRNNAGDRSAHHLGFRVAEPLAASPIDVQEPTRRVDQLVGVVGVVADELEASQLFQGPLVIGDFRLQRRLRGGQLRRLHLELVDVHEGENHPVDLIEQTVFPQQSVRGFVEADEQSVHEMAGDEDKRRRDPRVSTPDKYYDERLRQRAHPGCQRLAEDKGGPRRRTRQELVNNS